MQNDPKKRVERWAGDRFFDWYNSSHRTQFRFDHDAEPPDADLCYVDGERQLHVEVTGAFYDQDAARFEGMNLRGRRDAPDGWSSLKAGGNVVAVNAGLLDFVNEQLSKKSVKNYSRPPILVIHYFSRLLSREGVSRVLEQVAVPGQHPFSRICFLAEFHDETSEKPVFVQQLA